jgi:competence protein ComFC
MTAFQKCLNYLTDLVFPGNCPVCEQAPYNDGLSYMCVECEDLLAWIKKKGCKFCGIPMSGYDFNGLVCAGCREDPPLFKTGRCLFLLDQNGKKVIHEIKYHGVKDVLKDLPRWLDRNLSYREFLHGAYLIPVPLHRKRLKKRGFNQSLWIANAMKKELGDSVEVIDALTRTRDTPTQTEFDRMDRKKNVKNAFALKNKICLDIDQKIVLIDDVYTTGATLDECAKALIQEGCQNVNVATLGHG